MADVPIFWPVSPNAKVWKWGERHYFYNSHRISGDYEWMKNNLSEAKGSPTSKDIDASWTFAGKWEPEKEMPSVLPFIFLPKPRNASFNLDPKKIQLSWIPSRNSESFDIYFWKSKFPQALKQGQKLKNGKAAVGKPIFVKNQKERYFNLSNIENDATYYWRVDEIINGIKVEGPIWHFTTKKQLSIDTYLLDKSN